MISLVHLLLQLRGKIESGITLDATYAGKMAASEFLIHEPPNHNARKEKQEIAP